MDEDQWGCLIGAVVIIAAGYWLYSNYEVRKREPNPENVSAPAPVAALPRPTGTIELGPDKEGSVWKIDADSVRGPRKERQGWVIIDASKDKTEPYREKRILYQVDCETTAARELSSATYDANGRSLTGESVAPDKAEIQYWPPGTFGSTVAKFLCDVKFDPPTRD